MVRLAACQLGAALTANKWRCAPFSVVYLCGGFATLTTSLGLTAAMDPRAGGRVRRGAGLTMIPMLLAALAVLVGGTRAAVLGGAVSLLGAVAVAPFLLLPDIGLMALVFALFAATYACAGLAALKTRHARDRAITIVVGPAEAPVRP